LKKEYEQRKKELEEAKEREGETEAEAETKDVKRKTSEPGSGRRKTGSDKSDEKMIQVVLPKEDPKPWYKNPDWIRAVAAVVVMIIVILTFYFTFYL
jgi:hypothetical protein